MEEKEILRNIIINSENGKIEELKKYSNINKFVNRIFEYPKDNFETSLYVSIINKKPNITEFLLENGADPNLILKYPYPYFFSSPLQISIDQYLYPLFYAPFEKRYLMKIIELLLKHSANVNFSNINEEYPLDWAVRYKDKELEDLLKSFGAKHSNDFFNNKYKYFSFEELKLKDIYFEKENIQKIQRSLDISKDINIILSSQPYDVNTLLNIAIFNTIAIHYPKNKEAKLVNFLLDKGANPNQKVNGKTYLHLTLEYLENYFVQNYGDRELPPTNILEILIKYGADVNIIDYKGETPLDYAMKYINITAQDLLKKHNAKNSYKFINEHPNLLKDNEKDRNIYLRSIELNKYVDELWEKIEQFHKNKVNLKILGLPQIYEEVLITGFKLSKMSFNSKLSKEEKMINSMFGKVKELLRKGENINAKDNKGFTILDFDYAAELHENEITKKLEELGAKRSEDFQ